jgi:hypothetical protein
VKPWQRRVKILEISIQTFPAGRRLKSTARLCGRAAQSHREFERAQEYVDLHRFRVSHWRKARKLLREKT